MSQWKIKDPDAVLDFVYDWTDWLATDETITSYTVTVPTGLTKGDDSQADGLVTVWLSGGEVGETYDVVCHIETSAGRKDDRTMKVTVRER